MQLDVFSALKYIGTLMLATLGIVSPEALDEFESLDQKQAQDTVFYQQCINLKPAYLQKNVLYLSFQTKTQLEENDNNKEIAL